MEEFESSTTIKVGEEWRVIGERERNRESKGRQWDDGGCNCTAQHSRPTPQSVTSVTSHPLAALAFPPFACPPY